MTTFQRPGGPRRARKPDQVSPRDKPPSDAQRARSLAEAQGMLSDDPGTSLVERQPYDFRDEQPEPPRSKPALDWTAEAAQIEDVEPVLDIHTAEVSAEAHSEVLVSPEAMGAGAVGEEVSLIKQPYGSDATKTLIRAPSPEQNLASQTVNISSGITGSNHHATESGVSHLAALIRADAEGTGAFGDHLRWALDEIQRLHLGAVVLQWNLNMTEAPTDGRPVIVFGRYETATAGFPRMAHFIAGAWRDVGNRLNDPLKVWGWIDRDVLPEWPAEPA